jgi:hypothetical protein
MAKAVITPVQLDPFDDEQCTGKHTEIPMGGSNPPQ